MRIIFKKFHGIGRATVKVLHEMGIFTGLDLRNTPAELLKHRFGKRGEFYHQIAHGIDEREVKAERKHKSVGSEITFSQNTLDKATILNALYHEGEQAFHDLQKKQKLARTITIKIKYSDFSQITRSHSVKTPFTQLNDIYPWIDWLFEQTPSYLPIRLVGVTFSNLIDDSEIDQLLLF